MAEAAAAEVHAHPDGARLVGEDVHVVVAAPDRAELLPRLVVQRLRGARGGDGVPRRVVEQRVVDGASSARFFRPMPKLTVSRDLVAA